MTKPSLALFFSLSVCFYHFLTLPFDLEKKKAFETSIKNKFSLFFCFFFCAWLHVHVPKLLWCQADSTGRNSAWKRRTAPFGGRDLSLRSPTISSVSQPRWGGETLAGGGATSASLAWTDHRSMSTGSPNGCHAHQACLLGLTGEPEREYGRDPFFNS